jgi:hypothetical protein
MKLDYYNEIVKTSIGIRHEGREEGRVFSRNVRIPKQINICNNNNPPINNYHTGWEEHCVCVSVSLPKYGGPYKDVDQRS